MLNYTSVLSSLAAQHAPGVKEEGGLSMLKENAPSPRGNNLDLSSVHKSSGGRSSTNGKSSKHRPSSTSSHHSKPHKPSTAESDGERSESDLVIDTSVGGHQKHTNGGNSTGSGLLLPNGIKSELGESLTNESISEKESSAHRGSSSSGVKKERNTPQPNKAMTPSAGGPTNLSASQMPPGGGMSLPPGLAGRLPPGAGFGFNPGPFSSPEALAAAFGALGPHHGNPYGPFGHPFGQSDMAQVMAMAAQHQHAQQMAQAQAAAAAAQAAAVAVQRQQQQQQQQQTAAAATATATTWLE